ncbi:hypothetical protein [Okeania sp. SIO2C2]|nr:hypothetical protein [Okeania sp. SIO2C2]
MGKGRRQETGENPPLTPPNPPLTPPNPPLTPPRRGGEDRRKGEL